MDNIDIKLESLPFEEAVEFLRTKLAMKPAEFARLRRAARIHAFTISGIAALDILKDILDAITRSIETGGTIQEFRQEANQHLERRGWQGLTPYRLDNIYRTNIQTAFQVGRWRQLTDPDVVAGRPILIYDAVNDRRTRPSHRALDGVARPHDDPFWNTWYPPNGYRCRCSVRSASRREVERDGIKVESGRPSLIRQIPNGPAVPVAPDPGFDRNPAKQAWEPDLTKYPDKLRDAFLARQAERGGRDA